MIENECSAFDEEVEQMANSIFPHHLYSENAMMHSNHLDRIRAIAGKMGDDIEHWKERGLISQNLIDLYQYKIRVLKNRVDHMIGRVKSRKYTIWERLTEFFSCTYYFIFNMALYHIRDVILPNTQNMDKLTRLFRIFNKTAENFGDFLAAMTRDFTFSDESPESKE
jgi:hypothetical protein